MMRKTTTPTAASKGSDRLLQRHDEKGSKGKASFWNNWLLQLSTVTSMVMLVILVVSGKVLDGTVARSPTTIIIPECASAPWRPGEDLVGTCPGIRPVSSHELNLDTPEKCATHCCLSEECNIWQFRADKGCMQGSSDVRIGQEKDGPAAYCSDHPPLKWQGQFLNQPEERSKEKECASGGGHPDEQMGQCFGLGDPRKGITSASDCAKACCNDEKCQAWQFQQVLGCFYNAGMHGCQPSHDAIYFEPYIGRRKLQPGRTYTGKKGEPTVVRTGK